MWGSHVGFTCGVHMWGSHVGFTCGVHMWGSHVGFTCGVHMWGSHVGFTCGVHMWGSHVGFTCGVHMWGPYVGSICGIHMSTRITLTLAPSCTCDRSCAICRFRKGWSSLRRGTTHSKNHIQRLWHLAIDTPRTRRRNELGRAQKRAREQLQRHGFHRKRRCTMLDYASRILLRDPLNQRLLT